MRRKFSKGLSRFKWKSTFMVYLLVFLFFGFASCTNPQLKQTESSNFQKVKIDYAHGLRIWKDENGFKVEIRNPRDTSEQIATYYFDTDRDASAGDSIAIPVRSAALNSTTFIAFFDKLDLSKLVSGVTYTDRVMNENIKSQIASDHTLELASAGKLDFEKVLALNPDVFMAYSFGESDFSRIEAQNIPVVLNMEYLEPTPLGRAEWIKLVGILTGKFNLADRIFTEVRDQYLAVKTKAALSSSLPSVFTGSRYQNLWYAPGRDSYIANYIRDAGGSYVFENLEGAGSTEIDFEVALKAISEADYWGMVVSQQEPYTIESIRGEDPRYAAFNAFQANHIFVCNAAKVDYFGDAVMEPHEILKDIVAIIHPEIIPERDFKYFYPLET